MKKIFLCSLLASSLLGSTLTVARERLPEEIPKEERTKASWIKTKSAQVYQTIKETPGWVWWTGGGILVLSSITALGLYSYHEGVLEGFLGSSSKESTSSGHWGVGEEISDSPKTFAIKVLRADLDKVTEAVKDLETETYGTTFLGEEKVVVDGTDIYVVGN